ncbi:MAG: FliG C-terminal domain-containing protein [Planctomycetota bacterium]
MSDTDQKRKAGGAHRVAAFLLSLDKEVSANVMRHLDGRVVEKVAEAMTELAPDLCTPEAVDGLYEDLARNFHARAGVRAQDDFELFSILESSYGKDEAERVIREIHMRRRREQPFGFVEGLPGELVGRVLREESPAIVSLVLSHVSPTVSSAVLAAFDEDKTLEIVKRMTTITPPGVEVMLTIADDLQERLRAASEVPPPRALDASLRTVADMLNHSETEIETAVLQKLEEEDEEMAAQVRDLMFTWDDLAAIDKRAMQKILAAVDTRTLSMAIKACPEPVESNIMGNLSARVRDMVLDERELLGAVAFTEVAQARAEIMSAVRALMESGEFSPARAGEELVN